VYEMPLAERLKPPPLSSAEIFPKEECRKYEKRVWRGMEREDLIVSSPSVLLLVVIGAGCLVITSTTEVQAAVIGIVVVVVGAVVASSSSINESMVDGGIVAAAAGVGEGEGCGCHWVDLKFVFEE
jgi:hypothetical protein